MIFAAKSQTTPELAKVLHQIGQEASSYTSMNLTRVDLFPIHNFHQVYVTIPLLRMEENYEQSNFAVMEQLH